MGAFKSAVITKKGQTLMAKVVSGATKLNFTRIALSEANLGSDLVNITGIGTIKQSQPVASVVRQNNTYVKVGCSFSNESLSAGYYVRNIGLYATDPQEGEILYSVSVADESSKPAEWMPPFNGIGSSSILVDLVTAVSNASNVNVSVSPSAMATITQLNTVQAEVNDLKSFVGYEESDVYGVEIDFANRRFVRLAGAENLTGGADFDNLTPWGGRKRCIVADDGTVLAYRGEDGYVETGVTTKELKGKETGTKVQVMVEQPVFYVKAVPVKAQNATSGSGKQYVKGRFYISPTPKVGFTAPKAFYDQNGILQDKIYLSAFEGSIYDTSANAYLKADEQVADFATDMLCSISGAKPASGHTQNLTRANVRKLCNNRGEGWESHSIYAIMVTEWLLLVEYATLDAQRAVGRGVVDFVDDGSTNISVNTGATSPLGNASGIDPNGGVNGKCSVSYRGEENLWGNIWTWLDKINILAKGKNEVWLHEHGQPVADDTTTGYKKFGAWLAHREGFQNFFGIDAEYPEMFVPTDASGSDVFSGGYLWQNYNYNGFLIAVFGGRWYYGSRCGFCWLCDITSGYRNRVIGGRLLYVPQRKA